jgi:hypothetical protein
MTADLWKRSGVLYCRTEADRHFPGCVQRVGGEVAVGFVSRQSLLVQRLSRRVHGGST